MKAYKGFDEGLTCRGYQFEVGKEHIEEAAELCARGFHACESPLDIFNYYAPATSVYHEVELEGICEERHHIDSKVAGKKIIVGAQLDIAGLCKAQFEYVKEHTMTEHTDPKQSTAGDRGAATAGDSGAATAGYSGAATAGERGAATAGDSGAATAGYRGAATAGDRGAATAGDSGAATAGDRGAAMSRGSVSVGENGIAMVGIECDDSFDLLEWKTFEVDGEDIKVDTWYMLKNGKLVVAE